MLGEIFATINNPEQAGMISTRNQLSDLFGQPLYLNVSCRDLHRIRRDTEAIVQRDSELVFSRDEARLLNEACEVWPTYRDDERPMTLPSTQTPILVVQGDSRFPTPPQWAERVAATYDNATLVSVPIAGHNPLDQSGSSIARESGACLGGLMLSFIDKPDMPIDTLACSSTNPTLDLSTAHPRFY